MRNIYQTRGPKYTHNLSLNKPHQAAGIYAFIDQYMHYELIIILIKQIIPDQKFHFNT